MRHLNWLLSGVALGLLLALAPSCGPDAAHCTPANCLGCCTAAGKCELGTTSEACGARALACKVCNAQESCQAGLCQPLTTTTGDSGTSCDSSTCPNGCCNSAGQCITTESISACGLGGVACRSCTANQTCTGGDCVSPSDSGFTCSPSNCTGCCSNNQCKTGNTDTVCGKFGATCQNCANNSQVCQSNACTTPATQANVGDACTTDTQCSSLGTGAYCKKMTSSGNATYTGGYCTVPCTDNTPCTPLSSECFQPFSWGDSDAFCVAHCTGANTSGAKGSCRTGYSCYGSSDPGICFLYPPPTPTPMASGVPGKACTTDTTCGDVPAYCVPAQDGSGNATGYSGGYCSADCTAGASVCGSTGVCLGSQDSAGTQYYDCYESCPKPMFASTDGGCRTAYKCSPLQLLDGGASSTGACLPNCNNSGAGCATGYTCKPSGFCCNNTNTSDCY